MDAARLRRIARRQHGLFHRDQARDCGYSPKQIRSRIAGGEWRRVAATVLAAGDLPITPALADRAAQLAVPGSVLAGPSAAAYQGLAVPRTVPWIIVASRVNRAVPARVIVDRLDRRDVRPVEGTLVTAPERTVADCVALLPARTLPDRAAVHLLDDALQRGLATIAGLSDRARQRVGRRGTPRLVRLLGRVAAGSRSAAERRAAGLLRRAQVTGWAGNAEIRDGRGLIGVGDIVFARQRLVVELDGLAYHVTAPQFQRDRTRQNRLVAAGWRVLRFTWLDVTERPEYVVGTIVAMLGDR